VTVILRASPPAEVMNVHAERVLLHRIADQIEVGGAALLLSSATTGDALYVDCGHYLMGF
jgi:enoyl-[acyl-carrier-protein] reductase (NADH)